VCPHEEDDSAGQRERLFLALVNLEACHRAAFGIRGCCGLLLFIPMIPSMVGIEVMAATMATTNVLVSHALAVGAGLSGVVFGVSGCWMLGRVVLGYATLRARMATARMCYPDALPKSRAAWGTGALSAAWRMARWIEAAYLRRSATVRIVARGQLWLHATVRLHVDGALRAEAEEESGFDFEARMCPGTRYLEFRSGGERWGNDFYVLEEGEDEVTILELGYPRVAQLSVRRRESTAVAQQGPETRIRPW
jgi:hypothetical protein